MLGTLHEISTCSRLVTCLKQNFAENKNTSTKTSSEQLYKKIKMFMF